MEQNKEQLSFSKQLTQHVASDRFSIAEMFDRASASYLQNRRKQRIRNALAVAIGIVIGALAMCFLSLPERCIQL